MAEPHASAEQDRLDRWHMRRALDLAVQGQGAVEPNPMVGCVIAHGAEVIGEGWHQRFGGPHAEIEALKIAGPRAAGATLYVTLEPCCHHGKTPPCTEAIQAAGIRRVVAAMADPFPKVAGGGFQQLTAGGIEVTCGLLENEARELNAPYLKRLNTGRPWVIAKWAMTLDGKIASRVGSSRWISSELSRAEAHGLRGRVDAILIGSRTAAADDPLLTVRPPGLRTPLRVVFDSQATLAPDSRLVATAHETPLLVAVASDAPAAHCQTLQAAGCEVLPLAGSSQQERLLALLDELGRRQHTNLLVEGGGQLLGALFDQQQIDEVHVFIAPKLIGGATAVTPIAGLGLADMPAAQGLRQVEIRQLGPDVYIRGRVDR